MLAITEGVTWMTQIVKYLETDILLEDHNENRRIKKHTARYIVFPRRNCSEDPSPAVTCDASHRERPP